MNWREAGTWLGCVLKKIKGVKIVTSKLKRKTLSSFSQGLSSSLSFSLSLSLSFFFFAGKVCV
jgi:hypothetical protein